MYAQYVNGADKISHIMSEKAETMQKKPMQYNIHCILPPSN